MVNWGLSEQGSELGVGMDTIAAGCYGDDGFGGWDCQDKWQRGGGVGGWDFQIAFGEEGIVGRREPQDVLWICG